MKIHNVWFLIYGVWQTQSFVILDHFLPFYPPMNAENQKHHKIVILQMCIIDDSHMMYGSWDMECKRHTFLSFWAGFFFFVLWWWWIVFVVRLTDEKHLALFPAGTIVRDPHHLKSLTCCEQDLNLRRTWVPPNNLRNQNFENMKKYPGDIINSHRCNINGNHLMYGSRDIEHNRQNFLSL